MNFNTLEYEEVAAKLKRDGWAIKYGWSGEVGAFREWLLETHGIAATRNHGGFSFWVVDHYWQPPATARNLYNAWYSFGDQLEIDPDLTPDQVGFTRARGRRGR